jgi:RNA polymerase sigma factor (sigma-70 family)
MYRLERKMACHAMTFPWPGGARMLVTPLILEQCITVAGLGVTLPECCLMFVTGRVTSERDPADWATAGGDHRASYSATLELRKKNEGMDGVPKTLPGMADFERIVLLHLDATYNLARWLVADATLAEDVVQDSVVHDANYFGSHRGGDARAWLLQIVRNNAYSALGARKRSGMTGLDSMEPGPDGEHPALQVPDPADDSEAALDHREDLTRLNRTRLDRALAALPVELRECLVRQELEDLSYKEIAHVTDVPIETVMSQLWRARRALTPGQAQGATP